ncbi:MAG: hypothetical protein ACKPKO_14265, partial [Candidatus Fonsibacter sp.]
SDLCPRHILSENKITDFSQSPIQLRSPWQATKPSSTYEFLATHFSLEGQLQVHSEIPLLAKDLEGGLAELCWARGLPTTGLT